MDYEQAAEREQRLAEYRALEDEALRRDLLWIMAEPQGRRWIDVLLHRICGLHTSSYVAGDSYGTALNEGRRQVGLDLLGRLLHPDVVAFCDLMHKEHRDRIDQRNGFVAG